MGIMSQAFFWEPYRHSIFTMTLTGIQVVLLSPYCRWETWGLKGVACLGSQRARVRGGSPIHNYFLLKPKFFQPFPATYLCRVKSHAPALLGQSICTNYSEFFSMGDLFLQPHLLILNSASMVGSFWIHCSVVFFFPFLSEFQLLFSP